MSNLNPEIKAKWLTALRSGEYEQTSGKLHRIDTETKEDSFCCLGVLCDLYVKDGGELKQENVHDYVSYEDPESSEYDEESFPEGPLSGWPPLVVSKWLGENFGDYRVKSSATPHTHEIAKEMGMAGGSISLATLNDNGLTFEEIADLIENHM